jgi:hypothetical protein
MLVYCLSIRDSTTITTMLPAAIGVSGYTAHTPQNGAFGLGTAGAPLGPAQEGGRALALHHHIIA